jgi:hypothetical protein
LVHLLDGGGRGEGREGAAVFGLDATVDALRRAQADTLLLPPDWSEERLGWYGPDPLLLGLDRNELDALGVQDPGQAPICDLVVRAATGSDANATVLPPHILDLHGQPAAILRFTL